MSIFLRENTAMNNFKHMVLEDEYDFNFVRNCDTITTPGKRVAGLRTRDYKIGGAKGGPGTHFLLLISAF